MEQTFILNPLVDSTGLKHALYEKIAQVKAMTHCLLLASEELDGSLLYDAIWVVTDYLEQIEELQACLTSIP